MEKVAFFTIDVEDFCETYCVKNKKIKHGSPYDARKGLSLYVSLLNKYGIPVTMFLTRNCLNSWSAEIKEFISCGNEVAIHAYEHEDPTGYSKEEFGSAIKSMKSGIEKTLGVSPKGYRAPCFGITQKMLECLREEGFLFDSSALNCKMEAGSSSVSLADFEKINSVVYKDGDFYEIKPPSVKTFLGDMPICGGGYFRLLPFWFIKRSLKRYLKSADSYMFYVHPFELMTEKFPKYEGLSFLEKLYLNIGRKKYPHRIEKLIEVLLNGGYKFSTVSEYIKNVKKA